MEEALRSEAGGEYCDERYLMDDESLYYAMILQLAVNPAGRVEMPPNAWLCNRRQNIKIQVPSVLM